MMLRALPHAALLAFVLASLPYLHVYGDEIHRFAIVIGSNHAPDDSLQPLHYADDDAVRMFEVFSASAKSTRLLTVLDPESQKRFPGVADTAIIPTRENLIAALTDIFRGIEASKAADVKTELYLFYSGHGQLLPGNEGAITLDDGLFTRQDLYEQVLALSPAEFNHIVIDACNAYFMVNKRGDDPEWLDDDSGNRRLDVLSFFKNQDLDAYQNTGVILSTASRAESHEWAFFRGGIFSHEIRSGILGAADVTEDGLIEYSEIQAFVQAANFRVSDPRARINIYVRPPAKDLRKPFFDMASLRNITFLDIPKSVTGKFHLESENDLRYADFNKSPEQSVVLALLKSEVYFLKDDQTGREYQISPTGQVRIEFASLKPTRISPLAKGALDLSFRTNLFMLPFGKGFYSGMVSLLGAPEARHVRRDSWRFGEEGIMKNFEPSAHTWRHPVGWTLFATGLAAALGGSLLTWQADIKGDEYVDSVIRQNDLLNESVTFLSTGAGMFAASAALIGSGIYLLVEEGRRGPASNTEDPLEPPLSMFEANTVTDSTGLE